MIGVTPSRPSSSNLAVHYRPDRFGDLTGQRHVAAVLRPAIVEGRVPQQLLFSGGSGLGKTTLARIVAGAVLCVTPMSARELGDPCGTCVSCSAMAEDRHPDYVEFDAASHGGKDEIRDIASRAQTTPLLSSRRVYVIDEVHGLSHAGGQAFLKLLEEPPGHVMFMLCTTDPERMLRTNRGRCTEFQLSRPTRNEFVANLRRICSAEGWKVEDEVLDIVVERSDPELGVRGTVNNLQKVSQLLNAGIVTSSEVAALLGVAPQEHIQPVLDALSGISSLQAALTEARRVASEDALRVAFLQWLRTELHQPVMLTDSLTAAALMETLLRGTDDPAWLDLVMARAAASTTRPTMPTTQRRQRDRSQPVDADQENDTSRSATPSKLTASSGARRRDRQGDDMAGLAQPANKAPLDTPTVDRSSDGRTAPAVPMETGAAADEALVSGKVVNFDQATSFINAVARVEPELAEMLRQCVVTVTDNVRIVAPVGVRPGVESAMNLLRSTAGRAGLGVELA